MKKLCSRMFAVMFSVIILLGSMNITASAAEYKGKGTKSNPYIVETVEQLDGIRNNLKAHYKLGNTIDLSGVANFKPIGNLAKPFTGSFTCDTDDSGKPKYAIKNLKISVAPAGATLAEKFSGYKKNESGWEAGLFGCASGATFKNILVLDANVTNKVEGLYQMNGDFSINPGMDEQAAGILVAIGKKVTITGCGVSGTVTSSTNHVGGLIGHMTGKISKSYSYATVTSTGAWGSGGLVGSALATSISMCFYSGTFSGGSTHAGAFAGSVYENGTTVTDCWAEGTVKTESSGCFLGTKNHTDGSSLTNVDVAKNCYTLATIAGRTNAQTNRNIRNNNFITNAPGGLEIGFAAASQAEMNQVFKTLSNWTVADGSYPQIKGLVATKDAASYVVQEITAEDNTATEGETTEGETAEGEAVEGETTETEQKQPVDVQVSTVFDNTVVTLQGKELIIVTVLSVLVALTLIAAVVVVIVSICHNRPKGETTSKQKKKRNIEEIQQ